MDLQNIFEEIAKNAGRLLEDAQYLLGKGSYGTALSLAILAVEEAGKFFIKRWENSDTVINNKKGKFFHRKKQSIIGSFYLAEVAIDTIQEWERENKLSENQSLLDSEELATRVAKRMSKSKYGEILYKAHRGDIDLLKQKGLYVDVDSNAQIVSTPSSITKDEALIWIDHAKQAVNKVKQILNDK